LNKELKKQIKEDEILSGVEIAWKWVEQNKAMARNAALAIVAVAVLGSGFSFLRSRQEKQAAASFDAAMDLYERPYAAEIPGATPPGAPAPFATRNEKYTKAAAAFDGVERNHPTHALGRRARFYAALCRIELGDAPAAEKALKAIAEAQPASTLEGAQARVALADLQARGGALDKAVESYRALVEDAKLGVPRDYVLMSMAAALESAKRTTEAVASYKRLYEQFPESVYAQEAQRKAAYLRPEGQA
jgi:outer membrane protein assembly factor BamD (BamD/ComL family)